MATVHSPEKPGATTHARELAFVALGCFGLFGCFSPDDTTLANVGTDTDAATGSTGETSAPSTGDTTGGDPTGDSQESTGDEVVEAALDITADFVGLPVHLDASRSMVGSAGVEWEIVSAPADSTITSASLEDAAAVQTSFVPDLGGDYGIRLTVRASNGTSDSVTETVTAQTYTIPLLVVSGTDESSTRSPAVVRSDGTGYKEIGCLITESASSTRLWLQDFIDYGKHTVGILIPQGEGITHLAYRPESDDDSRIHLASEQTDCEDVPPTSTPAGRYHPRFSPSAQRVVALDSIEVTNDQGDVETRDRVVTFGIDGQDVRIIRTLEDNAFTPLYAPPVWLGEDRVLWVEQGTGNDQFMIYSTVDEENGFSNLLQRRTLMECLTQNPDAAGINQVALTPHGLVISWGVMVDPSTMETQLWLLEPTQDGETFECSPSSELNHLLAPIAGAHDFSVSPDGSQVVFSARIDPDRPDTGIRASSLYRVALDRRGEPTLVFADGESENTAPKWAANGRQIHWTSIVWERVVVSGSPNYDRPSVSRIMRVNANDSLEPRVIHTLNSTATMTRMLTTGPNGCAVSPQRRAPSVLMLALLALGYARRRSRRD